MKSWQMIAIILLIAYVLPAIALSMVVEPQEVDPMNRFLEEDVFIPQPWRYNIPEGEVRRSLIVTYVGPESEVGYGMHDIRSAMKKHPRIYCDGYFQPGLIRELNGTTGDLEIVCVYNWDIKTGARH